MCVYVQANISREKEKQMFYPLESRFHLIRPGLAAAIRLFKDFL